MTSYNASGADAALLAWSPDAPTIAFESDDALKSTKRRTARNELEDKHVQGEMTDEIASTSGFCVFDVHLTAWPEQHAERRLNRRSLGEDCRPDPGPARRHGAAAETD
jgi:hypothetical protein